MGPTSSSVVTAAQALALDDDTLSAIPHAGRDGDLTYRLRTTQSSPTVKLSASLSC